MFEKGFIQIAGIRSTREAKLLEDLNVQYLGFPLVLDFHEEDCTVEEARAIISQLGRRSVPILITYLKKPKEIQELCSFLSVQVVQLHAPVSTHALEELNKMSPKLEVIKSLIIGQEGEDPFLQAKRCASLVDAFLTDTFDAETGASGATGKTHNWQISQDLVTLFETPLILAGGLNPGNIGEAIRAVKPMGVDCHTGVEGKDGYKDPDKVAKFMVEAERAFKQ